MNEEENLQCSFEIGSCKSLNKLPGIFPYELLHMLTYLFVFPTFSLMLPNVALFLDHIYPKVAHSLLSGGSYLLKGSYN